MSEKSAIRQDPASDMRVILAPGRAGRPFDTVDPPGAGRPSRETCPFCPGHESMTPPEVLAIRGAGDANGPGWEVRVFPNKYPALEPFSEDAGVHEVIVESPDHDARWSTLTVGALSRVLETFRERLERVGTMPYVRYVSIWKNSGYAAGASLAHIHSQLLALPFVPPRVSGELARLERHQRETGHCLWCAVAAEEREGERRRIAANDAFVAWAPRASRFPFEVWVVPKRHRARFEATTEDDLSSLAHLLGDVTRRLDEVLERPDYNAVLQTAPWRTKGSELFHWRIELFPRLVRAGGLEWGTGVHLHHVLPEDAAERLRRANIDPSP